MSNSGTPFFFAEAEHALGDPPGLYLNVPTGVDPWDCSPSHGGSLECFIGGGPARWFPQWFSIASTGCSNGLLGHGDETGETTRLRQRTPMQKTLIYKYLNGFQETIRGNMEHIRKSEDARAENVMSPTVSYAP